MSNLRPAASTSSSSQQQTIEKLSKDPNIGNHLLPDRMEASGQPAGPSTLKDKLLPPRFLLQWLKKGVSKINKKGASNLNIQEDDSVRMMMQLAKYHPEWVIRNIGKFRIQNQQKLAEIALKCAEKASGKVVYGIKNFGIKDPAVRGDIALKYVENIPSVDINASSVGFTRLPAAMVLNTDERALDKVAIAQYIEGFDIQSEAVRIEIARKYAKKVPDALMEHFKNFAITDPDACREIALECAKVAPRTVVRYINNFDIKSEAVRFEIALECLKKAPEYVAQKFTEFDITAEAVCFEIAQECAKEAPLDVAKNFTNFDIKNKASRREIARKCAEINPWIVVKYINNFNLPDTDLFPEIVEKCLQENKFLCIQLSNHPELSLLRQELHCRGLVESEKPITAEAENSLLNGVWQHLNSINTHKPGCLTRAEQGNFVAAVLQLYDLTMAVKILCSIEPSYYSKVFSPSSEFYSKIIVHYNGIINSLRLETTLASGVLLGLYLAGSAFQDVSVFDIKNPNIRREIVRKCAEINPWSVLECTAHFFLSDTDVFREIVEKCLQENEFLCTQLSNHPRLSLLRQELYHRGLVELEEPVAAEGESPLLNNVLRHLKSMTIHESDHLSRAERGNLAAAVLQLYDPTMGETILDLIERGSDNKTIASCYKEIAPLRLQQRIAWEVLLRWSLAALAAQGVSVQELTISLNNNLFRTFRDKPKARSLLDVLLKIGENTKLNIEDKQWVVQQLKGIDEVKDIRTLFILKAEEHLKKGDISLKVRLDEAIRENIGANIDVPAFVADIKRTFGESRNPEAIWQFFASMKQTDETATMAAFRDYCSSVANGSFLEQRYDTKRSKHLEELVAIAPGSLAKWKEPVECAVNLSSATVDFDAKAWLKTKIVDDQHLGDFASAELIEFLGGSPSSAPALAWQPGQAAAFTQTCRELANATKRQRHIDLLNVLQRQLVDANFTGEFLNDIQGQLQLLTQPLRQPKGGLRGIDTDDPYHLLLCGTDVGGSCQRVDGSPHLNEGLLGYLLHGQTRLLAVVDAQGRIVTRALLRLLIGKSKHSKSYPVLFLERAYGNVAYEPTLRALAQQKAAAMGLRVAHLDNFARTHHNAPPPPPLESLGGPAPYEYCDASRGVCKNGEFTIEHATWL